MEYRLYLIKVMSIHIYIQSMIIPTYINTNKVNMNYLNVNNNFNLSCILHADKLRKQNQVAIVKI